MFLLLLYEYIELMIVLWFWFDTYKLSVDIIFGPALFLLSVYLRLDAGRILFLMTWTKNVFMLQLPSSGTETFGRERLKQFTYDYSYWSVADGSSNYASQEKVSLVRKLI